jgi:uncharacterized membrane protein YfcA
MTQVFLTMLVALIVGFVTTYLNITIDRVFLVLLLVLWMGMDMQQAIVINALVMGLAALLFFRGQKSHLAQIPRPVVGSIVILSLLGGLISRWVSLQLSDRTLLIVLGAYAIVVGLRLLILKPKMVPNGSYRTRASVITFIFSLLTGFISAGGKPLQIPLLVKRCKLSMAQAYLVASLGTMSAVAGLLIGQVWFARVTFEDLAWSWLYYAAITLVMFIFEPLRSNKVQKWVTLIAGVLLTLVGLKLII